MVKAYRDTWDLGLHSYLTYLRDRLLLAKELLHVSGSVFVQISDENLHHVREVMDEVLGPDQFCAEIAFSKTSGRTPKLLSQVSDYLVWYAKDQTHIKFRTVFEPRQPIENPYERYICVETEAGEIIDLSLAQKLGTERIPAGRLLRLQQATSQGDSDRDQREPVLFEGKEFRPPRGRHWSVTASGMQHVANKGRAYAVGKTLTWKSYRDEFAYRALTDNWGDGVGQTGFGADKLYVVQTNPEVVKRCLLMTTDPGDLVFDPTCGSGTTAYVAEQWGRRWITCDTSRVPLALSRQRLLTATFPYYELKVPKSGPVGGFVYQRKQNKKGEEVGGLVPHVTLKSIANDNQAVMEVLVDRPEALGDVTRVSGPFVVEATIAPAQSFEYPGQENSVAIGSADDPATHIERMTQLLRQSKTLQLPDNQSISLEGIRRLSDVEYLHAEAVQPDGKHRIAIIFGPEDGAISSDLVYNAASEAFFLKYAKLYFFGFAIQAKARELLEDRKKLRIPSFYIAVTPDVAMSDLLKTSRSSEIFSVTGLPDFELKATGKKNDSGDSLYQATLAGLDIFDPSTLKQDSIPAELVPAWMLDTDYDGMSFHATQVFFPKTSAWDNLQKSLKATFDDSVWGHLAGTTSEPFVLGDKRRVAVKVIDERGNELMRVRDVPK